MTSQYQLIMRSGPTPGAAYMLEGDQITIGRDLTNGIVINDAEISRRHARLTFQGGRAGWPRWTADGSAIAYLRSGLDELPALLQVTPAGRPAGPAIPALAGCEIHDDPLRPICRRCRDLSPNVWPRSDSRPRSASTSPRTARSVRTRCAAWSRSPSPSRSCG